MVECPGQVFGCSCPSLRSKLIPLAIQEEGMFVECHYFVRINAWNRSTIPEMDGSCFDNAVVGLSDFMLGIIWPMINAGTTVRHDSIPPRTTMQSEYQEEPLGFRP